MSDSATGKGTLLHVSGLEKSATAISCARDVSYGEVFRVYAGHLAVEDVDSKFLDEAVIFSFKSFGSVLKKHSAIEAAGSVPKSVIRAASIPPICRVAAISLATGRVDEDSWHLSDGLEVRFWGKLSDTLSRLPEDGAVNAPRLIELVDSGRCDVSGEIYSYGEAKAWFRSVTGVAWEDCRLVSRL